MPSLGNSVRRIRRNHALEHATVSLLLDDGVEPPLGGYSVQGGFILFARSSADEVLDAASEGLARLQEGESYLAVSPYCGTNLAAGGVLAGAMVSAVLRTARGTLMRFPAAAAAVVGASVLSRPIGGMLQSRYTTLADLDGVAIREVRTLWSGRVSLYWIGTSFSD